MAFYAYLTETTELTDNSVVTFDNIVTNYGDAYSDISGTFTGKHLSIFLVIFRYYYPHSEGMGKVLFSQVSVYTQSSPMEWISPSNLISQDRGYPQFRTGRYRVSGWGYPPIRLDGGSPLLSSGDRAVQ